LTNVLSKEIALLSEPGVWDAIVLVIEAAFVSNVENQSGDLSFTE
jgi:hypothetical protein